MRTKTMETKKIHSPKILADPTPIELAYIAGYLDGEGCWGQYDSCPLLAVDTCNCSTLKFIQKFFGGTICLNNRKTKSGRTVYRLKYSSQACIDVSEKLVDFLIEKKKQAETVLLIDKLKKDLKEEKTK